VTRLPHNLCLASCAVSFQKSADPTLAVFDARFAANVSWVDMRTFAEGQGEPSRLAHKPTNKYRMLRGLAVSERYNLHHRSTSQRADPDKGAQTTRLCAAASMLPRGNAASRSGSCSVLPERPQRRNARHSSQTVTGINSSSINVACTLFEKNPFAKNCCGFACTRFGCETYLVHGLAA